MWIWDLRTTRLGKRVVKDCLITERGATVMAAPFVIPMLNSVDFVAEDDDIGDKGEDVA